MPVSDQQRNTLPIDPRKLRSQRLRVVNYQGDALRLGMDWPEEDLAKLQVLVDSLAGYMRRVTHVRTPTASARIRETF